MDLLSLFTQSVLDKAIQLHDRNSLIVLRKDTHYVEAVIYDEYFYKVEITFSADYRILYPRVSKDGLRDVCPFSTPYAAALLYRLYRTNLYGLTYKQSHTDEPLTNQEDGFLQSSSLAHMHCTTHLLQDITRYILRLQNYNTEKTYTTFSSIIDNLFEYFDSIKKPQEQLVALQLFLHIYTKMEFDFDFQDEIHSALVDECNVRIHEIIENEPNPSNKYFFQTLLLNDAQITNYISHYNKSSRLNH